MRQIEEVSGLHRGQPHALPTPANDAAASYKHCEEGEDGVDTFRSNLQEYRSMLEGVMVVRWWKEPSETASESLHLSKAGRQDRAKLCFDLTLTCLRFEVELSTMAEIVEKVCLSLRQHFTSLRSSGRSP